MTSTHTLGSSGYANKKEEMKESRPDKSEPTEAEVYVAAHVHRDGTPLTAKVTEVIEKIADGTGGDDPLTLVLGENKCKYRPRTFGLAPAWAVRNSRKSIIKTALEVQRNADEKVVKVQEDMKQMEARHQDEMNQMKAEQVRIFTILEKMNPNALLNSTSDLNTSPNVAGDEPSLDHTRHVDDEGIHNDDSSTQDAYNLGVGSFVSMLQSPPRRVDITPRNVPNRNASRTDSPLHLSPSVPNALSIGRSMEMSDVGGVRISENLISSQGNEFENNVGGFVDSDPCSQVIYIVFSLYCNAQDTTS
ncbi:unnamed protein product [Linum trigynum]|uniref:Uncharacterized protein n=1 Tax=Linum trigynum TaxID=586398 RepID=A0AAV2CUI7_9ROSI